jgi:hypothetical protein
MVKQLSGSSGISCFVLNLYQPTNITDPSNKSDIGNNILTFPQFTKLQRCGLWDAIFDGNRSGNKNKRP